MTRIATVEPAGLALDAQRLRALECLLEGGTVVDAAASAGVDRSTVHRWLRRDCEFRAAYNHARLAFREALDARLLALAERATTTIGTAIERGDVAASIAVLKGLGLLGGRPAPIGSDDPDELRADEDLAARERESERDHKRMVLL